MSEMWWVLIALGGIFLMCIALGDIAKALHHVADAIREAKKDRLP